LPNAVHLCYTKEVHVLHVTLFRNTTLENLSHHNGNNRCGYYNISESIGMTRSSRRVQKEVFVTRDGTNLLLVANVIDPGFW
jgi:hypothetical protein